MPTKREEKWKHWAPTLLRVGLALVYLWFGYNQLVDTSAWLSWVPQSVATLLHISPELIVRGNGIVEIVFGLALLISLWTRLAALILALHMLPIIYFAGWNDIGVRDFGLTLATFAIFLFGVDIVSLDAVGAQTAS